MDDTPSTDDVNQGNEAQTDSVKRDTLQNITVERSTNVAIGTNSQVNIETHIHEAETKYDVHSLPNPYLGMSSYTYNDRAIYAGRSDTIDSAVRVITTPDEQRTLTFVTGASGSGKSSFVQAGLLPTLEKHYQERNLPVRWAVFRPLYKPLAELADALQKLALPATGHFDIVKGYMLSTSEVPASEDQVSLLVIDQFEELFILSLPDQRDALVTRLETLPSFSELRMHIIVTMRSDYLTSLLAHPKLNKIAARKIDLGAMTKENLRKAILKPIQEEYPNRGKQMEEGLVEALVEDAHLDASYLPLLQVALEKLWDDGILKQEKYVDLASSISERADLVLKRESPESPIERSQADQETILAIILDLVDVYGSSDGPRYIRKPRLKRQLIDSCPDRERLLPVLIDRRLLSITTQPDKEQQVIEKTLLVNIIHEALLVRWQLLIEELPKWSEILQRRRRFEEQLQLWVGDHFSEQYLLLTPVQLHDAKELKKRNDIALRDEYAQQLLETSIDFDNKQKYRQERERYFRQATRGAIYVGVGFGIYQTVFFWFGSVPIFTDLGRQLTTAFVIFFGMFPFGIGLGYSIGIHRYLWRNKSTYRSSIAILISALVGCVIQILFVGIGALGRTPVPIETWLLWSGIGALNGAGLCLGVRLMESVKWPIFVATFCVVFASILAVPLWLSTVAGKMSTNQMLFAVIASLSAAFVMGLLTAIGFSNPAKGNS